MKNNNTAGHLFALFTIVICGTTFISTKILLSNFRPIEILLFRFIIVLREKITAMSVIGTVLTLIRLFLSEGKIYLKKED